MAFVTPPRADLVSTLLDLSRPIASRMRAIFYLRSMGDEHLAENTAILCRALQDTRGTALFRHEIAYVLGQMQSVQAIPDLSAVLRNTADDVVVRHEVRVAGALFSPLRRPPALTMPPPPPCPPPLPTPPPPVR